MSTKLFAYSPLADAGVMIAVALAACQPAYRSRPILPREAQHAAMSSLFPEKITALLIE